MQGNSSDGDASQIGAKRGRRTGGGVGGEQGGEAGEGVPLRQAGLQPPGVLLQPRRQRVQRQGLQASKGV